MVTHDFGLSTRYGHLSRFNVHAGQRVARGDVIGYVGSTGRSTGAHLHYEILANGKQINPLQLLTQVSNKKQYVSTTQQCCWVSPRVRAAG